MTSARSWKNRILWNRRPSENDGGDIDEIVIDHPTSIHVEQVDGRRWWIGIYLTENGSEVRRWAGEFIADSRGRMTFYEIECDLEWDRDETHEQESGYDPSLSLPSNCRNCGELGVGDGHYVSSVGHDTPPEDAITPYYVCGRREGGR